MLTRRSRGWWSLLAAVVLGLLMTGTSAVQADEDSYSASVDVRDGYVDDVLPGATVELFDVDPDDDGAAPVDQVLTDGEGRATFEGLSEAHYWVVVSKDDYETQRTDAEIGPDQSTFEGVSLYPYTGTLSGSVQRSDTLGGDCAYVKVYRAGQDPEDYSSLTSTTTQDGDYSLSLPIGSYSIKIVDDCGDLPSVWVGPLGASYETATTFSVTKDQTTTVPTTTLRPGPSLSGVVKDSTGAPVRNLRVALLEAGQLPDDDSSSIKTGSDGAYRFSNLTPGTYDLYVSDPAGEYEATSQKDLVIESDVTRAVTVQKVTPGTDTSRLRGRVTSLQGVGVGGVDVMVEPIEGDDPSYFVTRRDGTFSANVPVGQYRVYFADADDAGQSYMGEWYDDAPTPMRAKIVTVSESGTPAINAKLARYGSISGTVSVPGTWSDTYFSVRLFDADGNAYDEDDDESVSSAGAYTFTHVKPGAYRLRASGSVYDDSGLGGSLVRQFFSGRYTLDGATSIVVGEGGRVTGRNVTLSRQLSATAAPKISGKARRNGTLKATSGTWSLTVDTQHAFQWYRGSSKIGGATKSTYKAGSSDVGKQLKVCVVASNRYDRYLPSKAVCSKATAKVAKK